MCACVVGGALVPAYIKPRDNTLIATTFFEQFFVGGVWGPIPVHLVELSPPVLRSLFYGFTYQLGNLASAASSTIEATIGERFPLPPIDGESRYNYGKVIGMSFVYLTKERKTNPHRHLSWRRVGIYPVVHVCWARDDPSGT